jgi:lambda family phage portal protein
MKTLRYDAGYSEAELVAARTASAKMGFITSDGEDAGPDPNEDNTDDVDRLMDASPGAIEELEPGQDFKQWDPQHPAGNFEPFKNAIMREIAMGLDVAAASLSGDLSRVNYSSIRTGVLDERDTWRELQRFASERFYDPNYRAWVPMAQLTGALALEGHASRWFDIEWRPRGWAWVDPLKDGQANVLEVDNGFNSRTRVLAENGLDFEDVLAELAYEQEAAEKVGVVFPGIAKLQIEKDGDDDADKNDDKSKKKSLLRVSR